MASARKKILITGGSGFIGSHLVEYLHKKKSPHIVIFDSLKPPTQHTNTSYVAGNMLSENDIKRVFSTHGPFETVFHLASSMPNKAVSNKVMWETNVQGTKYLIQQAVKHNVRSFIFTSSNVTYGIPPELPVTENTPPHPLETYGKSKLQAEKELEKYKENLTIQIFRCPVVTGVGRLGLQAILYEFISENRNVYVLGDGSNRYQFVDVKDVCQALEKATRMKGFDLYTIGADQVLSLREIYQEVIAFAHSTSRIVPLPGKLGMWILSVLDSLNVSPLGVYQYTMMGRSIYADTTKIKRKLGWKPLKTNLDTFIENYRWYSKHKGTFTEIGSGHSSANKSLPKMGIFRILKWLS